MKYLVDSDWVADYLKGRPPAVQLLDSLVAGGMAISIVTYAELLEGIYYGHDPMHFEGIFRRFLRGVAVLSVSRGIAGRYARISGSLRAQGLLIPPPDLFIAATALERRLIPLSRAFRRAGFREFGRQREVRWRERGRCDVIYMECLAREFLSQP